MFDKRSVRHTVTVHIHIHVSSYSIFLVWKRNCGYAMCEGGTAGLEAKGLVRKRNCGTSSRSVFLVWKRNFQTLFLERKWNFKNKSHKIFYVRKRNLKYNCGISELKTKNFPCAEAELRILVRAFSLCGNGIVELQVTEQSVVGSGTSSHRIFYVWNISGSLCNGPKDTGAQGRRPLGQSHLDGAVIY